MGDTGQLKASGGQNKCPQSSWPQGTQAGIRLSSETLIPIHLCAVLQQGVVCVCVCVCVCV